MDAATIETLVRENLPDLHAVALEAIKGRIKAEIGYNLPPQIKTAIDKFMAEEIAPEVASMLASEKGVILEAVRKATAEIGVKLSEEMVKNAAAVLTGYSGKEIISKLVGGR